MVLAECVVLVYPLTRWQAEQPLAFRLFHTRRCAATGAGVGLSLSRSSCVSPRWLVKEFPAFLARAVHTWICGALFPPGFVSGSRTLPVEY